MFLSITELLDIVIMTAFVGYIFTGVFKRPRHEEYDPLKHYSRGFDWNDFKFAALAVAPAILLHELAHKTVALSFGLSAVFNAAYTWLALGLIMKLMNFGFIFFVPAYVNIMGQGTPLEFSLIAFAGPLMNLILWLSTAALLKYKVTKKKYVPLLFITKQVNMFLFIFNMLPIPGFDGSKVFYGLYQAFF